MSSRSNASFSSWSLLTIAVGAAAVFFWPRRLGRPEKLSKPEDEFRRLLAEEEKQTRPFPKDIDLEPPFE
jgi:hypothetical protein